MSNTYLYHVCGIASEIGYQAFSILLGDRAARGDKEAERYAKQLLALPQGSGRKKMAIAQKLVEAGLLKQDQVVSMRMGNKTSEVRLLEQEITREPLKTRLNPAQDMRHDQAMDEVMGGNPGKGIELLQALIKAVPDEPMLYGNLAAAYDIAGRPRAEAEAQLKKAIEIDPDYLSGRCNLAKFAIIGNQLDEAETLLKGLWNRNLLHISEVIALMGTEAMLHAARGEEELAHKKLAQLEKFLEYDDELEKLEWHRTQVNLRLGKHGAIFKQVLSRLFGQS